MVFQPKRVILSVKSLVFWYLKLRTHWLLPFINYPSQADYSCTMFTEFMNWKKKNFPMSMMCRTWHKNVNGIGFTWLIFLVLLCIQNESSCLLSTKANLIVHIELKIQQSTFRYHLLTKIRCVTISNSVIKCHLNGQNPYWRTVHVYVCQIWIKFRIPKYI